MEEIKPKRKASNSHNGQAAGERSTTHRAPRAEKNQQNNNAPRKPRRRPGHQVAAADTASASQSVPAPRSRRSRGPQGQNNATAANKTQTRRGRKQQARGYEMTPAIPMHICPLGGLGEVGKNITLCECQGDMILVDCGLVFPDADMFGVDLVIPDFTYVLEN